MGGAGSAHVPPKRVPRNAGSIQGFANARKDCVENEGDMRAFLGRRVRGMAGPCGGKLLLVANARQFFPPTAGAPPAADRRTSKLLDVIAGNAPVLSLRRHALGDRREFLEQRDYGPRGSSVARHEQGSDRQQRGQSGPATIEDRHPTGYGCRNSGTAPELKKIGSPSGPRHSTRAVAGPQMDDGNLRQASSPGSTFRGQAESWNRFLRSVPCFRQQSGGISLGVLAVKGAIIDREAFSFIPELAIG